jgi:hypothetical protein
MFFHQQLRKAMNSFCFLRTESAWLDDALDIGDLLTAHAVRIVCQLPKGWCHAIDHFVGALGAEDHRHEQGIGIDMIEWDFELGIEFIKSLMNQIRSLLSLHL